MTHGDAAQSTGGRAGRPPGGPIKSLLSRHNVAQLALFAANGVAVGLIYSLVVWTFVFVSPDTFVLDVVAAYAISVLANYVGARLIFKPTTSARVHLVKYLVVVVGNFLTAAAVAWLLDRLGSARVVNAYAPVVVTAVPTFLLMRFWVFRDQGSSARLHVGEAEVEVPGV